MTKEDMSLELGGRSKTIQYLNLSKSGMESENDRAKAEVCTQTVKFTNQPFLKDQSEYLAAVTRFSVPLVEVPTISATHFTIYKYSQPDIDYYKTNLLGDEKADDNDIKEEFFDHMEDYLDVGLPGFPSISEHRVNISACFSFHEFMKKIQIALQATTAADYFLNFNNQNNPGSRAAPDTIGLVTGNLANTYGPRVIPFSQRIKMSLTADMRFQIMISDDIYTSHIYVKLAPGMFRMLQFQTSESATHSLSSHEGFRFHGRHFDNNDGSLSAADRAALGGVSVSAIRSDFNQRGVEQGKTGLPLAPGTIEQQFISTDIVRYAPRFVVHTAHMSCADATRIREIIFTSDMAVKSEGNVGSSYKRFLCDYQVFNNTKFSYNLTSRLNLDPYSTAFPNVGDVSTVTEELPSHRVYQSANASAGRWQELIVPAPLWEVEVKAQVRCWNFETNKYDIEEIPLPAGMEYSVKLIFVSKENHTVSVSEKPDVFHP